jgi:DNA-directed RNA polymerase specialized sigma24 family protein
VFLRQVVSTEAKGSVTNWIADLRAGNLAAASPLWKRYFERMVELAGATLGESPCAAFDDEDVALSAFENLTRGLAEGRFPELHDRNDLWRLLVVITARKALTQLQHERRQKRGAGQVFTESTLPPKDSSDGDYGLNQVAGREPPPEALAIFAEQCQHLFESLGDDSLRQVVCLRLEGCTSEEIAERLGCNRRTVTRKLELIRQTWLGLVP